MVVAVAKMELHVPASRSLKAKRQVVRRILDRTRSKFNVAAAEVDFQQTWQRTALGFAVVSADRRHADAMIQKVVSFVESMHVAPVIGCQREVLSYGEVFGMDDDSWDHMVNHDDHDPNARDE